MNLEQAARQALEALERSHQYIDEYHPEWIQVRFENEGAITALREALAEQAEQEPVAWGCRFQDGSIHDCICPESHAECEGDYNIPLYAALVRTKDLTDDEIDALVDSACDSQMPMDMFARAVIAADREKNRA